MDWLEHDEVPVDALPDWARAPGEVLDGRPFDVTVLAEGVVLARGRLASAVRWEDILVPVRVDEPRRLLLAAPRPPPRPPWFELGGRDVGAIERAIRMRLEAVDHRGYRESRRAREPLPPDVVLTRVLDRDPLPGAVEIPAAAPGVARTMLKGAALGAAALGLFGLMVDPSLLLTGIGALGGAGLAGSVERLRRRAPGRVLVLTPDAFVGGLDGVSVRAVPWFRVGRFSEGVDDSGESALEVFGPAGELIARVARRFFGKPLDVIVAVAEAYRRRATEELA